jgi:hypothetical protein
MINSGNLTDAEKTAIREALDTILPAPLTEPEIPVVALIRGSRGDQLAAKYSQLKPQVDALTKELKEITDAIKVEAELAMTKIGAKGAVDLRAPSLERPLRFSSYEKTTVDGKALKAAHPAIYWEVSKTSVVWTLRAVSG